MAAMVKILPKATFTWPVGIGERPSATAAHVHIPTNEDHMVGVAQGPLAISSVDISSRCSVITFRGPRLGAASHWSRTDVQGGWVVWGGVPIFPALPYGFFPPGPPWAPLAKPMSLTVFGRWTMWS